MVVEYTQLSQLNQQGLDQKIENNDLGHTILAITLIEKKTGLSLTPLNFYKNIELNDLSYKSIDYALDNVKFKDINLVSGMWNMLDKLIQEVVSEKGIKKMESDDTALVGYDVNDDFTILFICKENQEYSKESEEMIIKTLKQTEELINQDYIEDLKNFTGDLSPFKSLKEYMRKKFDFGYHNKKVIECIEMLRSDIENCSEMAHESFMRLKRFNELLPGLEINMDYYSELMINNYRHLFLKFYDKMK